MTLPLDHWHRLASDPAVLDEVADLDPRDVAAVAAIRRRHDADLVHVALELTAARRKAERKFGAHIAAALWADVSGVEQASSGALAAHKAARLAARSAPILDLCCGIGGDLMAFAACGAAEGIDLDPARVWMAQRNVPSARVTCADVGAIDVRDRVVHLDPMRRAADGGRRHRFAEYDPPPAVITAIMADAAGGAIKLGPGIDHAELAALDAEPEFVSERGTLVQCIAWFGAAACASGNAAATIIDRAGAVRTRCAVPAPVPLDGTGAVAQRWIGVPDAALERAGLIHDALPPDGAGELAPGLGICVSDAPLPAPWFDGARIVQVLPYREAKVRAALRDLDAGLITVRTRGGAADPDRLQRAWRGRGSRALSVFVLRLGRKVVAVIADAGVTPAAPASNAPSVT